MYLSYSGWNKSEGCDFTYWNGYINHTSLETPDDRLGSIFGSVVGRLFEEFYNEQLWRRDQPQGLLMERVERTIKRVIRDETTTTSKWRKAGVLQWKGEEEGQNPKALYASEEDIAADVRDAIERGFRIIRAERLVSPDARAEVKLDADIEGHRIGGRADFRMTRALPHRDRVIVDGKGSKWRDKYVDEAQLLWYAMLNRKTAGYLPDRLGFLYWRYDPPESMDWIEVTEKKVDDLQQRVLASIARIEQLTKTLGSVSDPEKARTVFLPVAERENVERATVEQACRFCVYATPALCPKGAEIAAKLAAKK